MKPTAPLLLITILVGTAGGLMVGWTATRIVFAELALRGPGTMMALVALGLAAVGGLASVFHMHHVQAARYILRGWKSSWLSREVVTTGGFVVLVGVVALAPLIWTLPAGWVLAGDLVASLAGLIAMYVTAMIYATIPAIRSWHSPLTVLVMPGIGLVTGWMLETTLLGVSGHPLSVLNFSRGLALTGLLFLALCKGLQWRWFGDARARIIASTGTGIPVGPYRLQDTGTSRPPYHSQTQTWPALDPKRRTWLYVGLAGLLGIGPAAAYIGGITRTGVHEPLLAAGLGLALAGAFLERWLFFGDATHSSQVWFIDHAWAPSSVATPRLSPGFVGRYRKHEVHRG